MKARPIPRPTWRLFIAIAVLAALPAAALAQFPAFIPMPGVTPEGVAVDKPGNVYVSVREGTQGSIWKYERDGGTSLVATLGTGTIGGLAVSPNGDLYAAMASGPDQGVYRIGRDGTISLLPGSEAIVFANALAFDPRGNLYVTESYSGGPGAYGLGGVWRITPGGEAEVWLRSPMLTGIGYLGFPVGANGIAYYHRDLYVANTDKAMVVRVPILHDGTAGAPTVWKQLGPVAGQPPVASPFPVMPDGLALDVHGNVYLAVVSRNAVVRVKADDLTQETVAVLMTIAPDLYTVAPLDTPASLAFGTGAGEQQNLFIANLGWTKDMVPIPRAWPGPGLVKVDAGFPGRPLQ